MVANLASNHELHEPQAGTKTVLCSHVMDLALNVRGRQATMCKCLDKIPKNAESQRA